MNQRRRLVLLVTLLSFGPMADHTYAQTKDDEKLKAYGQRVGDRDQASNDAQLDINRRLNSRLDTRINSRLNTRIERFSLQQVDEKSTYTPQFDDGTKTAVSKPKADEKP